MKDRAYDIIFGMLIGAVILALAYTTFQRNKVYKTEVGMWDDVVGKVPENRRAYDERSVAHVRANNYEMALKDTNRVLESGKVDARMLCNRGAIYLKLENPNQAIVDFNMAIEMDPKYYQAYHNRAIAHYYLRQYDRAIIDFEKSHELNPVFARSKQAGNLLNICKRLTSAAKNGEAR